MIIKGGSRSNWRYWAAHLMNTRDNDRVEVREIRGVSGETVLDAFREMDAVASGTRCDNFMYQANLNPRDGEKLTPEQWMASVDALEENLGYQGQPRVVVRQIKNGREHYHAAWSRINVDTMTALPDSLTARIHERTSRELEEKFELQPVESILLKDRETPRPERRPRNWETFRGYKAGIKPDDVKAEVTALWNETGSGAAFRAALAERGYLLCKGDRRDFCIIDRNGNDHSLARRIEGAKAADVRARLADIDRDALPAVGGGRGERRSDKRLVESAVAAGANKSKVTAAINATRASQVIILPESFRAEQEHRDAYERLAAAGRSESQPPPDSPRPEWQAREHGRRRERDREPER